MINHLINLILKNNSKTDCFVTSGVGFSSLQKIKEIYGERFINTGIAENCMIGFAAGLSKKDRKVFTYTMASFLTTKCFEQIKLDIVYHNRNVCMIGHGTGLYYSNQGVTHHCFEDISLIRSIPEIKLYNPGSILELEKCFELIISSSDPSYIRLGRVTKDNFKVQGYKFENYIFENKTGTKLTVITSGILLQELSEVLKIEGVQLLSCPILSDIKMNDLLNLISAKKVLIVEDVVSSGGLAERFSKYCLEIGRGFDRFKAISIRDEFIEVLGSEIFMRKHMGIDSDNLLKYINELKN